MRLNISWYRRLFNCATVYLILYYQSLKDCSPNSFHVWVDMSRRKLEDDSGLEMAALCRSRICTMFREFLSDFGWVFKKAMFFSEIGSNAGQGVVQGLRAAGSVRMSQWATSCANCLNGNVEVNALIFEGLNRKLYMCRIDIIRNTWNVLE